MLYLLNFMDLFSEFQVVEDRVEVVSWCHGRII